MKKTNILYLHAHDTGRYIEPYGYPAATPNLQRLATEGTTFRQAFCAGPTCSPSRAALLTGMYPHAAGMWGLAHRGFGLYDYKKHILHTLRKAGYESALAGVQHIAHSREPWRTIGYDRFLGRTGHPFSDECRKTAESAAAFLSERHERPFFLSVGFGKPHSVKEPELNPAYCRPPAGLPDTPETRHHTARFLSGVRIIDSVMGRVLEALRENGLEENTLVVCTTDHGPAFPGMKCTLKDGGTGVLLIMRGPGPFTGGKVVDELVSHVDIFPSLCEYLDLPAPHWLQGVSFMPFLSGSTREIRKHVFSEVNFHAAREPMRAVRTKRWKYIRRFEPRSSPVLPNCDDSPSKDLWLAHGWQERGVPEEELYDLVFDPCETNNLARTSQTADTQKLLRDELDLWMQSTRDPLLEGPMQAPEIALINSPDGVSPTEMERDGIEPHEWEKHGRQISR